MNFKKTLTALAVAGVFATPMAAQADVYASARIGLQHLDSKGNAEMTVRGVASRLGFKGESDLGNGMTGWGKYEFSINTEGGDATEEVTNTDGDDVDVLSDAGVAIGRRHAVVGLKGDFGGIYLGQTYHTFYNHLVGPLDIPWIGSGFAMVSYTGRTAQGLSYSGDFGPVSVGVTANMDGSAKSSAAVPAAGTTPAKSASPEDIDNLEIAVSFDAGPVRIGVGMQDKAGFDNGTDPTIDAGVNAFSRDPEPVIGITVSGIELGPVTLGIGYQMQDVDGPTSFDTPTTVKSFSTSSITIDAGIGPVYVHYETKDNDGQTNVDYDPTEAGSSKKVGDNTSLAIGYTRSLGKNTTGYVEYHVVDADDGLRDAISGDSTGLRAVLKYDIM